MTEKSSGQPPLLEVEDYHFSFPSYPGLPGQELFKGINFHLNRGEFRIILGKPESGKTTLGRCLTALYPGLTQAKIHGRILIDGEPVSNRSTCDWIDRISIVFQDPDEQIVTTRCDDEAAFALESQGIDPQLIQDRMSRAFREFGVLWPGDRNPLSLSGGEKKRLLLSCMRMQETDLWILDEPLDELDYDGQISLLETLSNLAVRENRGILLFASKFHQAFSSVSAGLVLLDKGLLTAIDKGDSLRSVLSANGLIPSPQKVRVPPQNGSETGTAARERSSALLDIRDLEYRYPNNPEFSLKIDRFSLSAGETVLLAGPNGCGKSTLARLFCGLIQASSGTILLEGQPGEKALLNRSCGYLFQNPDYQLFLPTVADELELGLTHTPLSRKERVDRVRRAVELFHLPGLEAPPSLMSFGGRKRLQGAIYSLLNKKLYILDEADSGLNYTDYETIVEQLRQKECALLIITHNRDIPFIGGDTLYTMAEGRILGEKKFERVNPL